MLKKFRKLAVAAFAIATLAAVPLATPALVSAEDTQIQNGVCNGVDLKFGDNGGCAATTSEGTDKINDIISKVIEIFSVVVGVISVIMIIFGGFRYVTSGGDSSKITSAKNTIIYAIIGLVVVAMAQFIVKFVLNRVTSGS